MFQNHKYRNHPKQLNLKHFGALMLAALLVGCKTYSVSLNNNVVYVPPSLFKDFSIADAHLRDCVEQTIVDNKISKAEDLKQLNCSHAGINNLAGLEKFYAIEQLNLAENNLVNVAQISNLGLLKVLILRKNNLTNAEPFLHLLHLKELDVSDNEKLPCHDLQQMLANFHQGDVKVILPEQCTKKG